MYLILYIYLICIIYIDHKYIWIIYIVLVILYITSAYDFFFF